MKEDIFMKKIMAWFLSAFDCIQMKFWSYIYSCYLEVVLVCLYFIRTLILYYSANSNEEQYKEF